MGLKEVMEETREQLKEAEKREGIEQEEEIKALDSAVEEVKEDPKPEEPKAEEAKPNEEEKSQEVIAKTPTDYSKERQARKDKMAAEIAAANAKIAELERRLAPQQEIRKESPQEPDINTNPTEWVAWKLKQQDVELRSVSEWTQEQKKLKSREELRQRAVNELTNYENQMRKSAPDYDDVKNYYGNMLATAIKMVNPRITQDKLLEAVNTRIITRAAELESEGYENPVEAMYLEAKGLGYKPREKESEEEPKPDLDRVAAAKKRNAGMTGGSGGGGESSVTAKSAATMTNAEFARLKPEQKKKIFQSLR